MGGSNFELLMEEVLNQKQLMDELMTENYNLRRQLADLREGRGIILDIQGQLFTLASETVVRTPEIGQTLQSSPIMEQTTTFMPVSMPTSQTGQIDQAEQPIGTISETSMPSTDQFEQMTQAFHVNAEEEAPATTSTFLEDMLVDEFATAATSPLAVWRGSKTRKLTMSDEEEKAELRKELIGSFLLE
ncbi:MAG: hypothetical protein M3Y76_04390 [Chloroflexota bacterium]|nr:hypothetical protein [Chloroflexota bacterium]